MRFEVMELFLELNGFDGKHVQALESLADRYLDDPSIVDELIAIARCDTPRLQVAATWLLKRLRERDVCFSAAHELGLLDLLPRMLCADARIHLLQLLPSLQIPSDRQITLHRVLYEFLDDQNKFVRAWSYGGLAVLAEQYPTLRDDVATTLSEAEQTESASVCARLRNLGKSAPWWVDRHT